MSSKNLINFIKYRPLFKQEAYIGGRWVSAASKKTFNVNNPFNNEIIGSAPDMDEKDVNNAIISANAAFETWKRTTGRERAAHLRKWFDLIMHHADDLAAILTVEAGKPLSESKGELMYGASFVEWFAEEAKRIGGEIPQSPAASKQMMFLREPIGVVGMITPWNFPNAMLLRKAGAAIASGCTCIERPAEDTPFSALAVAALAEEAGIPQGVFNVVTSNRENAGLIGKILCESDKVAGISFTGSTAVGKILYKQSASTVKRIGLELGGNAPFIVFDSANLDAAVNGFMVAKFRNAGQTCISANRLYLHSNIYDSFINKLKEKISQTLIIGDGLEKAVTLGPLINKRQADKVHAIVQDSIKQGATLIMGGMPHEAGELFYQPTILVNCNSSMECFTNEIFGPVVAIEKFDSEETAIQEANAINKGLAAYFYSQDVTQVTRVSRKIESGMIGVNEGLISAAEAAFGGIKESGIGREGSHHGIDEYTEIKYVCLGGIN